MKTQKISRKNKIIIVLAVILSIGILTFAVVKNYKKNTIPAVSVNYDKFAQCVTGKGAVLYTLNGCPHCLAQKNLLGGSLKYIREIECSSNSQKCIDAGIVDVPTWIIGDNKIEGFDKDTTMKKLSEITSCELPL